MSRKLADSGYLVITHNKAYVRLAKKFLDEKKLFRFGSEFPPILDLPTITVAAFFSHGTAFPDDRIDTQLAAACYSARLPDARWEEEFWSRLEHHRNSSEETKNRLQSQLISNALRQVLREASYGSVDILKKIDIPARIKEAEKKAELEKEDAVAAGQSDGFREAVTFFIEVFLRLLFLIAAVLFILMALLAQASEWLATSPPNWLVYPGRFFLVILAVLSALGSIGYIVKINFKKYARMLEPHISKLLQRFR